MAGTENLHKISFFDILCLGTNAIIGSGIFLLPGLLVRETGPASIAAFAVCGTLLVSVALCYAELGSIFTRNGGSYVYAREAFGPGVGFGVGWISWVTSIFSWAAVANAVSSYLGYFHQAFDSPWGSKAVAGCLVVVFGMINYRGIRLGAWTVNVFTIGKIIPLALFAAVGIFHLRPENFHPFLGAGHGTFGYAVFLALWSLQGFEVTPLAAGEARDPQRAVPFAAVGSLLFSTLFYILIQTVVVGVAGPEVSADRPLVQVAAVFFGSAGAVLIACGAVVSMIGYNAGNALGSPRFLSALAEDRFLPRRFCTSHPRFFTPSLAIVATTALTLAATLLLDFVSLITISNLVVIVQYLSTCAAVIWLRRRRPDLERRFTIPAGTAVALAGCAVSLWLVQQVRLQEVMLVLAILAAGFVFLGLYRLARRFGA